VVLSSKTYWLFGKDISGAPFPKPLFYTETESGLSNLSSVILSVIIGPLKSNLINIRIPFVILNLLSEFLLYKFLKKVTNNKLLATTVSIVFLVNPWIFLYSRATTEAQFALFFEILGIYLIFTTEGKKVLFARLSFFLAFLS
jgi:hypothetical protein